MRQKEVNPLAMIFDALLRQCIMQIAYKHQILEAEQQGDMLAGLLTVILLRFGGKLELSKDELQIAHGYGFTTRRTARDGVELVIISEGIRR